MRVIDNLNQFPTVSTALHNQSILLRRLIKGIMSQPIDKRESIPSPLLEAYTKAGHHNMVAYLRQSCLP